MGKGSESPPKEVECGTRYKSYLSSRNSLIQKHLTSRNRGLFDVLIDATSMLCIDSMISDVLS